MNFLRYPLKIHSTCRQKQVCHFCRASLLFKHLSAIAWRAVSLENTDKSWITNIFRLSWQTANLQGTKPPSAGQYFHSRTTPLRQDLAGASSDRPTAESGHTSSAFGPPDMVTQSLWYSPSQYWPGEQRQEHTHLQRSPPPVPSCLPLTLPGTLGETTRFCDNCPPNKHSLLPYIPAKACLC